MRSLFLIASVSMLAACGNNKSDTADDTFAPSEGGWSWGSTEYTKDECNIEESFPTGTIDVLVWDLVLTDDGFQLSNDTWDDDPIVCVVTDMDFSCPITLDSTRDEWPEGSENEGVPDAVYTFTSTVTGAFSDAESGTIGMNVDATCEGADCDEYGEESGNLAPCNTVLAGDFDLSE